jgi:hypothetical protein
MEAVIKNSEGIRSEVSNALILSILSLSLGAFSYGEHWWTIGLSLLFPVLLFQAETRVGAFLAALLYHVGATRSLAITAGSFLGNDVLFGLGVWIVGNVFNAIIYASLWQNKISMRLLTIPVAVILTAIPPLGVLGWANPLIAAGVVFPGAGILGFAYLLGVYASLCTKAKGPLKVFGLISLWCFLSAPSIKNSPLEGISSTFQKTSDNGVGDYDRQSDLRERSDVKKGKILLMPEAMVTGGWTEVGKKFWRGEKRTVLMGAEIKISRPENVIVNVKTGETYFQRQPIPFSMWRPFDSRSYNSHWFENPILAAEGVKVAPLICYEGFLVWPIVHSYLSGAKFIAATGNYWWAKDSQIPQIHESIIKSWSRLFSMPYTMAVNL